MRNYRLINAQVASVAQRWCEINAIDLACWRVAWKRLDLTVVAGFVGNLRNFCMSPKGHFRLTECRSVGENSNLLTFHLP